MCGDTFTIETAHDEEPIFWNHKGGTIMKYYQYECSE